jgi:hypothetical protein
MNKTSNFFYNLLMVFLNSNLKYFFIQDNKNKKKDIKYFFSSIIKNKITPPFNIIKPEIILLKLLTDMNEVTMKRNMISSKDFNFDIYFICKIFDFFNINYHSISTTDITQEYLLNNHKSFSIPIENMNDYNRKKISENPPIIILYNDYVILQKSFIPTLNILNYDPNAIIKGDTITFNNHIYHLDTKITKMNDNNFFTISSNFTYNPNDIKTNKPPSISIYIQANSYTTI